jgi:hypothetical protein
MNEKSLTLPTSQLDRFLLNEIALLNMLCMDSIFVTFHGERLPLNKDAPLNIAEKFRTFPTFHCDKSLLNEAAWSNI